MMTKRKWILILGILLALLFCLWTLGVCMLDVAPIGPLGSEIGFSSLNGAFARSWGTHDTWYTVSELTGVLSFLTAAVYACFGAYRLIRKRSLRGVGKELYCMAGLYVAVALCYLFFEVFVINCRPILSEGILEASYPSSHTMFAVTIMGGAAIDLFERFANRRGLRILSMVTVLLIGGVTVVGRLLSGVHWLSDIIGSLFLGGALLCFFAVARDVCFEWRKNEKV